MHNNAALTRVLLLVVPIASFAAFALTGLYIALSVLVAGIIVLVACRRSLPDALIGTWLGPWWVWSLVGLATSGSGFIVTNIPVPGPGELRWLLFTLLFFAGALIMGASIVRAFALLMRRPPTPTLKE